MVSSLKAFLNKKIYYSKKKKQVEKNYTNFNKLLMRNRSKYIFQFIDIINDKNYLIAQ